MRLGALILVVSGLLAACGEDGSYPNDYAQSACEQQCRAQGYNCGFDPYCLDGQWHYDRCGSPLQNADLIASVRDFSESRD